jgi:V-type H+-transporting ATPase 16kDa proteolipid subunit
METQSSAVLFGLVGAGSALILSSIGAAYGTAASANWSPKTSAPETSGYELLDKPKHSEQSNSKKSFIISLIPIIIAGVLAIYGLIYSVIVLSAVTVSDYSADQGYAQFVGGLTVGLCCLASGIAVGAVGKQGLRSISQNKSTVVRVVINLIYCEALGLYGLIFGLIAASIISSQILQK